MRTIMRRMYDLFVGLLIGTVLFLVYTIYTDGDMTAKIGCRAQSHTNSVAYEQCVTNNTH